jgi:hypothetical protein
MRMSCYGTEKERWIVIVRANGAGELDDSLISQIAHCTHPVMGTAVDKCWCKTTTHSNNNNAHHGLSQHAHDATSSWAHRRRSLQVRAAKWRQQQQQQPQQQQQE